METKPSARWMAGAAWLAPRDALQANGKAVEFVEVKSVADQALATTDARLAALTALLDFLAKRDPAP